MSNSTSQNDFHFDLNDAERQHLLQLARLAITSRLGGEEPELAPPLTEKLRQHLGAFVTIKMKGGLRGCIGHIIGDQPLDKTIFSMARRAAFEDPRFPPLTPEEGEAMHLEISVLSPLAPCPDPAEIEVGRHGLLLRQGARQGLLLPQVAVEWGWDKEQFLAHTCRKAGLDASCWRDPTTQIYWFEAVVFGE